MLVLERIASVIGPVFLIIAIGYGYGRRNQPDLKSFNHVSLHVLGPLLQQSQTPLDALTGAGQCGANPARVPTGPTRRG